MLAFPDRDGLVRQAIGRLGDKWVPELVRTLAPGPKRFNHLRLELAIAPKVLASVLRGLQGDGFVSRLESPVMQRQVAYGLTPLGQALDRLLDEVEAWGERSRHMAAAGRGATPFTVALRMRADPPPAQQPPLEALPTHLCLSVRDATASASAFARLFGVSRPPVERGTVFGPAGAQGGISRCAFRLANFAVELIQPHEGHSPFREFVDRFGDGVHHIGLRVTSDFEEKIRRVENAGGRWTLGGLGDGYILFDLSEQLGSTLELVTPAQDEFSSAACRVRRPGVLGSHALGHIGVIVKDVEEAARQYAHMLGVGTSPVRTIEPGFPGKYAGRGYARIVSMRQKGVPLVLIEPVGPSPWQDFLEARGNAVHHIQFNVGARFDTLVRSLRNQGGRRVLGRAGLDYAHFDFTREIGLVVGLTGTTGPWRQPRPSRAA